jgi:hypothetical protein
MTCTDAEKASIACVAIWTLYLIYHCVAVPAGWPVIALD